MRAGGVEETTDVGVAGFRAQPFSGSVVVTMRQCPQPRCLAMAFSIWALTSYAFLGCLRHVADGQFCFELGPRNVRWHVGIAGVVTCVSSCFCKGWRCGNVKEVTAG